MNLLLLFINKLVYKYLRVFSILISNMAITNRYNLHQQKLLEVLDNFSEYKRVLRAHLWELLLSSNLSHSFLSQICHTDGESCLSIAQIPGTVLSVLHET